MKYPNLVFISILVIFASCSLSPKPIAPKKIAGYIFEINTLHASGKDLPYLNQNVYYYFELHDIYYVVMNGKKVEQGDYAYKQVDHQTASVIHTYSEENGLSNYKLVFTFDTFESGVWKGTYRSDHEITASGTFRILRHGRSL